MKTILIKTASCIAVLTGLLMLVGDVPGASLGKFAALKAAGAALLWAGARIYERFIPDETETI